ncbi:MAG TPA: anthranilate phosphoribosyltransferase [Pirellulales bacterium]|jgi:anthranilate phosphoribosyltransferase|nr:anthranilate phosphoribosyltransferase [Pirellulales bacterium]
MGNDFLLATILGRLSAGENLSQSEAADLFQQVVQGRCSPGELGLLLTALRSKGETADEIAGAASALRQQMIPIRSERTGLLDTCGTGGDGSSTFNISTAAALVTAAAGVPVAKHGNRKVTSRSGSADVLTALGVNVEASVATVEACLAELGLCFCFAPLLHPAMKQVSDVRRALGGRTIFNLLGPLTNPANAPYRLLGVGQASFRPLLADALAKLGVRRALVVHGADGLDEVTVCAETLVTEVAADGTRREFRWTPADFGVDRADPAALAVEGPEASAAVIRAVLANQPGAARDITLINAAAALLTAGAAADLPSAMSRCAEALASGAAADLLARLAARSQAR